MKITLNDVLLLVISIVSNKKSTFLQKFFLIQDLTTHCGKFLERNAIEVFKHFLLSQNS